MDLTIKNTEAVNVIAYLGIGSLVLLGAIALLGTFYNISNAPEIQYDTISGSGIDSTETGGLSENLITAVGWDGLGAVDINEDIGYEATDILRKFLTITYPKASSFSYKKNSFAGDRYYYKYEIVTDIGDKFFIETTDFRDGNFAITIADKRNKILEYTSKKHVSAPKSPKNLGEMLPKTIEDDGLAFSITETNDKKYQINVNSCGDIEIQEKAKALATEWVTELGYDAVKINFVIPNLCDGGF